MSQRGEKRDAIRSKHVIWITTAGLILLKKANMHSARLTWTCVCPAWGWVAIPPYAADVRVCRGVPVSVRRCWKEFCSCGVWSGCLGDLDGLKCVPVVAGAGARWLGRSLKALCPRMCLLRKQTKMNTLIYTAAGSDRCQLKWQSSVSLCGNLHCCNTVWDFFCLFVQTYEEKKNLL